MKCLNCKVERKYISERRTCCSKCEKIVPIAMSAPGLFLDRHVSSATLFARAAVQELKRINAVRFAIGKRLGEV